VTIVSNSSPLICLAKIESFNLLQQLYGTLTISAEVYAEVVVLGAGLPEPLRLRARPGFR
jgi:predicted nucleic acid-binding protein